MSLWLNCNVFNADRLDIQLEMVPVNELLLRWSCSRLRKRLHDFGMGPLIMLLLIDNDDKPSRIDLRFKTNR